MLFLIGSPLFGNFSVLQGRERERKEKKSLYTFLFLLPPPLPLHYPFLCSPSPHEVSWSEACCEELSVTATTSMALHLGTGAVLIPNFPELALTKLWAEQEWKRRDYCNHKLSVSPWCSLVHRLGVINGCNWVACELQCAGCFSL